MTRNGHPVRRQAMEGIWAMTERFAEPEEANLDHLIFGHDPVISAFARWLETEAGPDDWHCVAETWNWDAGEDPLWWIVTRPDCDRATALMVFWKSGPHHYLGRDRWENVHADDYDLYHTIRARWAAGCYTRSELAFDCETDGHAVDVVALRRSFGDEVDRVMPLAMRRLAGRRLDARDYIEGLPSRFWDVEEDYDEDDIEDTVAAVPQPLGR
jgi:hypothetical protein